VCNCHHGSKMATQYKKVNCIHTWKMLKKLKQSLYTPWRRRGREVELLLILDLGTRWGEWSASRPGRTFTPGKGPPVPIVQEAGRAPGKVWIQRLDEKSFHLCQGSNLDRSVVQPIATHYTDWATRTIFNELPVKKNTLNSGHRLCGMELKHIKRFLSLSHNFTAMSTTAALLVAIAGATSFPLSWQPRTKSNPVYKNHW
jgi:hypothetical protein